VVELDPGLASHLRTALPYAHVIEADAVAALPTLAFDVLLTNLPHDLTPVIVEMLGDLPFRVAVLAVRAGQRLAVPPVLGSAEVARLDEDDFAPPQPFASTVIRVVRRPARGSG
jgi:16S rRNA A1518/A1519 N6-dimethyltransferase RsmA/KsgA/DIM1 with predicted DNA glycosylase/AP lyase activity